MRKISNKAFSVLGLCLLLMSFSPITNGAEQPTDEVAICRYLYLKVTSYSLEGDYSIYSKILEVKAKNKESMETQMHDLIFAFEDELYSKFPQTHFVASHNWVGGTFENAAHAEMQRQQKMSEDDNAVEIHLSGVTVMY